jgi:hypothetical protein
VKRRAYPGGMGRDVLGGFVTFTVSLEQAKGITLPVTAEAELRQALPPKDVPIVDFAVNLDGLTVKRWWPVLQGVSGCA